MVANFLISVPVKDARGSKSRREAGEMGKTQARNVRGVASHALLNRLRRQVDTLGRRGDWKAALKGYS